MCLLHGLQTTGSKEEVITRLLHWQVPMADVVTDAASKSYVRLLSTGTFLPVNHSEFDPLKALTNSLIGAVFF